MKRSFLIIIIMVFLLSITCAAPKIINGKSYRAYGLISKDRKESGIIYKKKVGSIILSILLFETVIFPIIALGYRLYEPDTLKREVINADSL